MLPTVSSSVFQAMRGVVYTSPLGGASLVRSRLGAARRFVGGEHRVIQGEEREVPTGMAGSEDRISLRVALVEEIVGVHLMDSRGWPEAIYGSDVGR